jgi:DNA ligase (NAD+)
METSFLLSRTNFFLASSTYDEAFIRAQIAELRTIIIEHNTRYYQTSDPIVSDTEYDQLFALLQEREDRYPDLIVTNSPTQRLIGQKIDAFASARHLAEMISLQNTYSAQDIAKRDE